MDKEMFALANLVLCFTAVGMCLCRLNSMTVDVIYRVRSKYSIILTAALASALQPWWGEWPQWGALAMSASLVYALTIGTAHWRKGPPSSVCDPRKPECRP